MTTKTTFDFYVLAGEEIGVDVIGAIVPLLEKVRVTSMRAGRAPNRARR